jgi:hypothetical protein
MNKDVCRNLMIAAVGLGVAIPSAVQAQATATGLIDLTSLDLTAAGGSILWSDTWTVTQTTYASANNVSDSGTATAQSTPADATSVAIAPYSGVSGIFGLALGQINSLPGSEPASASASTVLATTFTTSDEPQLTFDASVSSILTAQAGLLSAVLFSDDSISIQVDGNPVLSWSDSINAPAGQTAPTDSQNPSLSNTYSPADGGHDLTITLDTAQSIVPNIVVPEPSSAALLVAGLLFLTACPISQFRTKRSSFG